MKIHDISIPISSDMIVYKNKPEKKPIIETIRTLAQGAQETRISIDVHTGTHIDSPNHMIANGGGIETIPLDHLMGPCRVIDCTKLHDRITAADIDQHVPQKGEFILFKTKNSFDTQFNPQFVYLDATRARSLAKAHVRGVGIDALGIERDQPEHETHITLLQKGIIILEGLRLGHITPGKYHLLAIPLLIPGSDGAPCRAVLVEGYHG